MLLCWWVPNPEAKAWKEEIFFKKMPRYSSPRVELLTTTPVEVSGISVIR